jgi:ADP-heptose:LPS heptosyltransferase
MKPPRPVADTVAVFSYEEIIGDGLYKIPFVRALRSTWPDAEISWITTRRTVLASRLRPLTEGLIDQFHQDSGIGNGISDLVRPLRLKRRYSVIIDTQSVIWRTLTLRRLPHDLFISPATGFRLSDRRPGPDRIKPPHMVDRLLELLELACGHKPVLSARIVLPGDVEARAAQALPDGPVYVGFAPGAGKRIKCWPLDHFIAAARVQVACGRVPVFILGPDEVEWRPQLQAAVPEALFPEQDTAVWGNEFSPLKTVALARRLTAAVANDSGVSHMFGAADIPLLTLYGPTDAEKFRPRVSRGAILRAQSFGGDDMAVIPVTAVLQEFEKLIKLCPDRI